MLFLQASINSLMTCHCWGEVDDEVSMGDGAAVSSMVVGLVFSFSATSRIRGPYRST